MDDGPNWKVPKKSNANSDPLLTLSKELGLEGLVAKKLSSTYKPGRRSRSWIKIKNVQRQEFVIGGWLEGDRKGEIGSLLVGVWNNQRLLFAGAVGSGLTQQSRSMFRSELTTVDTCPFVKRPKLTKQPTWSTSLLTVEVEFLAWPKGGRMRHPSLKGVRRDKDPNRSSESSTTSHQSSRSGKIP